MPSLPQKSSRVSTLMMGLMRRLIPTFALIWLVPSATAALVEDIVKVPVEFSDASQRTHQQVITVTVFRDDTRPKSPFLILNHGRSSTAEGRVKLGRARYDSNAAWFVERGFAVFVPTRIGYGVTGGPDLEGAAAGGPCDSRDFGGMFGVAADQNVALVQFVKSQTYVDSQRGLLVGQSVGGATTVALTAKNIAGIVGAINFAGGAGARPGSEPENPCSQPTIARVWSDYGKTARAPMLWLHSENDRAWGKALPHKWFEAFKSHGAVAEFVQLPPSGENGHGSFTTNPAAWKPHVESFLKALGFSD
jgi:dienelactone hydrolase